MSFMIPSSLGNKIKCAAVPISKSFSIKGIRICPKIFIVHGRIQIQKNSPAFRKMRVLPVKRFFHFCCDKWKERIESPYLLNEIKVEFMLIFLKPFLVLRIFVERMGGKNDIPGDRNYRAIKFSISTVTISFGK